MFEGTLAVALTVLIPAIVFVARAVRIVPQHNAWVVERLGRSPTPPRARSDALGKMAKENNTMIVPANLTDVASWVATATSVVRRAADLPGSAATRAPA